MVGENVKISILMASYNPTREYLIKSITSVLKQTYQNIELIIVDDASSNPIDKVLIECGIKDKRVKVIRSEINLGLAKALNIGLKYCNGEYIARMDDDDICHLARLESQLNYINRNQQVVGCWTGYNRINENDIIINTNIDKSDKNKFLEVLISKGNKFSHSTLFVKKDIINEINGYDENLRYAQDSDLYIRILERYNMGYVPEALLDFRINNSRQNMYKDSFSAICSLFGAYSFYLRNYKQIKWRILFYTRVIRFIISAVILYPVRNKIWVKE